MSDQMFGPARWDPLVEQRSRHDPPLDVVTSGRVFFDIVFTQLDRMPRPGEELWAGGLGSCPGGIANLAIASSRLGLRTGLVAGFGDDAYADWMWETLQGQERIDLSGSRRFDSFHTSLTVAMSVAGDRAMVTHGHELPEPLDDPILHGPLSRAAVVDLGGETAWFGPLKDRGTVLYADIGFDETGAWDPADLEPLRHCRAFMPNSVEAMAYTRTRTPASALAALSELVEIAVVTDGAGGAYAVDQSTGESCHAPAIPVEAVDPTGAGDVFCAAMVLGCLASWPLEHRVRFASLCAGLAVQQFGGSLAAPGWGDLVDWWNSQRLRTKAGDAAASELVTSYGFLDELLPSGPVQGVRRAQATFGIHSDLH